jgi:nucleoside-diphosphate-sugar epimerase
MAAYLVTGAAGFIGAGLAERLLDDGGRVIGLDNLNDAYDRRLKEWRLARLRERAGFEFHQVDIADREALERTVDGAEFEVVFNLAARAGVRPSLKNPRLYFESNLTAALNLLELARQRRLPKFVQASTSSLYGSHNPRPFSESADISRPLSPYAASKGAAELLCHTYHRLFDLDITILRYFTVYGPAGRPDMSIFRFIQRIAEDRPLVIYGDGRQERDFTFRDDIIAGTAAAIRPLGFEVINLGGDRPVALLEVVRLLETRLGRRARLEHQPEAPADVRGTWADISKAHELLGWRPSTDLEQGLDRSVEWYLAERSWASTIDTDD